jgi:hypothetical protein
MDSMNLADRAALDALRATVAADVSESVWAEVEKQADEVGVLGLTGSARQLVHSLVSKHGNHNQQSHGGGKGGGSASDAGGSAGGKGGGSSDSASVSNVDARDAVTGKAQMRAEKLSEKIGDFRDRKRASKELNSDDDSRLASIESSVDRMRGHIGDPDNAANPREVEFIRREIVGAAAGLRSAATADFGENITNFTNKTVDEYLSGLSNLPKD